VIRMLKKLLQKEWRKVLATGCVLSITKSSRMIALESGLPFEQCKKNLMNFLLNEERALFLNENQVIDICVLGDKSIQSVQHLYQIFKREYIIKCRQDQSRRDQTIFIPNLVAEATKCEGHSPNNVLQNQISEIISLYDTWQQFRGDAQRKKAQREGLYLILKEKGAPQQSRDIYLNACFLPIFFNNNEAHNALASSKRFHRLLWDHWSCKPTSPEDVICLHQWLWKRKNFCGGHKILNDLLGNYLRKAKQFTIDDLEFGLKILGFSINRVILEHILIYAFNCHRVSYASWTTDEGDPFCFIPNFKVVWERTLQLWRQNLSEKEKYILNNRILKGQTLEEVGNGLGLTRERVRQIETSLLKYLSHHTRMCYLKPYFDWIWEFLQREKIISLEEFGVLPGQYKLFDLAASKFGKLKKGISRVHRDIVVLRSVFVDFTGLASRIAKDSDCFLDLYELVLKLGLQEKTFQCKKILEEVYGLLEVEEGIYYCNDILVPENRKKLSLCLDDEFFLTLYYARRPLHYTEMKQVAERIGLPFSLVKEKNILSAIQRSPRIKRVAPGTYGLKTWEIADHIYLKDLVYVVLKELNRPLTLEEIYQEVQKRRHDEISRTSVYAYVNTHPRIMYTTAKKYILEDWGRDDIKLKKFDLKSQDIITNGSSCPWKVILEVFQFQGRYTTKYRASESYLGYNNIRISRGVKLKFGSKIIVIGTSGELYFESITHELILGLREWGRGVRVDSIFYLEFFNEHIVRCLSEEQFKVYEPLPDKLLKKAEGLWEAECLKVKMRDTYWRIKQSLGRRPTRLDMYEGSDIPFREYLKDGWLRFLESVEELEPEEEGWLDTPAEEFLKEVEQTRFTKAYKLPTIRAFLHQGTIRERVQLREIGEEMMSFYRDYPLHQKDLNNRSNRNWRSWGVDEFVRLAKNNPVKFLSRGQFFHYDEINKVMYLDSEVEPFLSPKLAFHVDDILIYRGTDYFRRRYKD
jgi:hypothetical protein